MTVGLSFENFCQAYFTMEQCKHALESYIKGEHVKNADSLVYVYMCVHMYVCYMYLCMYMCIHKRI